MFCTNCGTSLKEGDRFCKACGTACVGADAGGAMGNGAVPPEMGIVMQPQRSKAPIVAVVAAVAAVLVCGLVLGFNLGGIRGGSSSASTAPVSQASAEPSAKSAEIAVEEKSSSSAEEGDLLPSSGSGSTDFEGTATVGTSKSYDLSDPAKYKQMNLFLSNFSEANWSTEGRDVANISDEDMAKFAVMHVGINTKDQCESANREDGWGIPKDNVAGGPNGTRNIRIKADRIKELCQRYFGRTINFDALAVARHPGWVVYQDGYVYYGVTNGTGYAQGVSLAKQATVQPDGTIRVEFDVYGMFYDSGDESLYSCSPSELKKRLEANKTHLPEPHETGVAVVRQGEYNEYTNGLVLVSFEMNRTY